MDSYWEKFWEHRYIERHGCPSQGVWQDIRNQVAFIYDSLVNCTPHTSFGLLELLIQYTSHEISASLSAQSGLSDASRRQAEDQLGRLTDRLRELQLRMSEGLPNMTELVLRQLGESFSQHRYNTNFGPATGVILDLAAMNDNIEGAINIIAQQHNGHQTLGFENEASMNPLRNISPTNSLGSVSDLSTSHHLPDYNETVHGIRPQRLNHLGTTQRQLGNNARPLGSHSEGSTIRYCPSLKPPDYQSGLPPDYWTEHSSTVHSRERARRGIMRRSSDSQTLPYRPTPRMSLHDGVRQISTCFVPDPRNHHSQECAMQLGIHQRGALAAVNERQRRYTTVQRRTSNPTTQDMIAYASGQRRSLEMLTPSPRTVSSNFADAMQYEFFSDQIPETSVLLEMEREMSNEQPTNSESSFEGETACVGPDPFDSAYSDEGEHRVFSWRRTPPSAYATLRAQDNRSNTSSPFSLLGMDQRLISAMERSNFPTDVEADIADVVARSQPRMFKPINFNYSTGRITECERPITPPYEEDELETCNTSEFVDNLLNPRTPHLLRASLTQERSSGITEDANESADYLEYAHEEKRLADVRDGPHFKWLQEREESFLKLAANSWLPLDIHRRKPNRFDALSLHGDTSQLEYWRCNDESNDDSNKPSCPRPRSASPSYLRGGLSEDESMITSRRMPGPRFLIDMAEFRLPIRGRFGTDGHEYTLYGSDGAQPSVWKFVVLFINSRGNEYFCEIDEDYLTDRFNLTSLNTEVQYYQYALDLITDVLDIEVDDDTREQIEKSARHLYGLVHARYIVTTRGLAKMCEKYKNGDFGKCPRIACEGQPLLPMGQNDNANTSAVKLYCARCEDLYNPKSSRHASVDGAYFGSSFHNMFFQIYPNLMPPKSQKRYEPRIFGFRVHAPAALARWQAARREELKEMVRNEGLETGFEEEEREEEMDESEGDEDPGQDGIDDMFEGQRVSYQ